MAALAALSGAALASDSVLRGASDVIDKRVIPRVVNSLATRLGDAGDWNSVAGDRVRVGPRAVVKLPYVVQGNDVLRWEFCVRAHDVRFSVSERRMASGGAVEVGRRPLHPRTRPRGAELGVAQRAAHGGVVRPQRARHGGLRRRAQLRRQRRRRRRRRRRRPLRSTCRLGGRPVEKIEKSSRRRRCDWRRRRRCGRRRRGRGRGRSHCRQNCGTPRWQCGFDGSCANRRHVLGVLVGVLVVLAVDDHCWRNERWRR